MNLEPRLCNGCQVRHHERCPGPASCDCTSEVHQRLRREQELEEGYKAMAEEVADEHRQRRRRRKRDADRARLIENFVRTVQGFAETLDIMADPDEYAETLQAIQEAQEGGEAVKLTKEEALARWGPGHEATDVDEDAEALRRAERRDLILTRIVHEDSQALRRLRDEEEGDEDQERRQKRDKFLEKFVTQRADLLRRLKDS